MNIFSFIVLLAVSGLFSFVHSVPAERKINAVVMRNDGLSGPAFVASGFPLPPGALRSEDLSYVRVFVRDVEQACAVGATRGRHPDGTLRSIIIEFNYNIPDNQTIPAYVQLGGIKRQVLDIDFVRITYNIVAKVIISPSDPEYLCSTNAVLSPLVPANMDSPEVQAWQESIEQAWSSIVSSGTAIYDYGTGLLAWYMRTGDVHAIRQAVKEATWSISYYIPFANDTDICSADQINVLNPERLDGQYHACGLTAEWWSLRYYMNHAFYMFFGWEQYLYQSWHQSQGFMKTLTSTYCLTGDFGPRYNFGIRLIPTVMAYMSEGITKIDGGYGAGAGDPNFPQILPLIIDCLDYNKFNWPNDFRYGLVGFMNTTVDIPNYSGYTPTFQLSVVADFLILYYQNIRTDPRIPPMIKAIGDFVIRELEPSIEGEPGYPNSWVMQYISRQGERPAEPRPWEPYLFPMFTNTYGFLYAYYKNDTYKLYGLRSIDPDQMAGFIWLTKAWGEVYNAHRHSFSYYMNGGSPEGLESTRPGAQIPPVSNTTDPVGNTKVTKIEAPRPSGQVSAGFNLISNVVLLLTTLLVSIHFQTRSAHVESGFLTTVPPHNKHLRR